MPLRIYPRVIDLVVAIRKDGGISNEIKYKKGNHMYYNINQRVTCIFKTAAPPTHSANIRKISSTMNIRKKL